MDTDDTNPTPSNSESPLAPWIDPTLEARLVALILGESSAFEEAELRAAIAEQPELQAFHDRISAAHEMLARADEPGSGAGWQLPDERRGELLKKFRSADAAVADRAAAGGLKRIGATPRRRRVLASWLAVAAAIALVLSACFLLSGKQARKFASAAEADARVSQSWTPPPPPSGSDDSVVRYAYSNGWEAPPDTLSAPAGQADAPAPPARKRRGFLSGIDPQAGSRSAGRPAATSPAGSIEFFDEPMREQSGEAPLLGAQVREGSSLSDFGLDSDQNAAVGGGGFGGGGGEPFAITRYDSGFRADGAVADVDGDGLADIDEFAADFTSGVGAPKDSLALGSNLSEPSSGPTTRPDLSFEFYGERASRNGRLSESGNAVEPQPEAQPETRSKLSDQYARETAGRQASESLPELEQAVQKQEQLVEAARENMIREMDESGIVDLRGNPSRIYGRGLQSGSDELVKESKLKDSPPITEAELDAIKNSDRFMSEMDVAGNSGESSQLPEEPSALKSFGDDQIPANTEPSPLPDVNIPTLGAIGGAQTATDDGEVSPDAPVLASIADAKRGAETTTKFNEEETEDSSPSDGLIDSLGRLQGEAATREGKRQASSQPGEIASSGLEARGFAKDRYLERSRSRRLSDRDQLRDQSETAKPSPAVAEGTERDLAVEEKADPGAPASGGYSGRVITGSVQQPSDEEEVWRTKDSDLEALHKEAYELMRSEDQIALRIAKQPLVDNKSLFAWQQTENGQAQGQGQTVDELQSNLGDKLWEETEELAAADTRELAEKVLDASTEKLQEVTAALEASPVTGEQQETESFFSTLEITQRNGQLSDPDHAQISSVNNSWGFVVLNAGTQQGIDSEAKLDVLRGGEKIAELSVAALEDNRSVLDIVTDSLKPGESVRPGDRVALPGNAAPAAATPDSNPNFDLETATGDEPFSTFSLNVSDVSFKLASTALLEQNAFPDAERVRVEEFVNAFDYGDPQASLDERVACQIEQAAHPFLQQRNLMRVAMRTAAAGRSADQPLRLTILLDKSGSMEREDREESVLRTMQALAKHLGPADQITAIAFARTPRLIADRLSGDRAEELVGLVAGTPSEGGTNLEEALSLAGTLAGRQFDESAVNRIVLITDGAANLGDADPESLMEQVISLRQQGIAFDACGVGANGLNDTALEALTRKGDGRYYFIDKPADADAKFVRQLAGSLRPAAKNVKVQVKFNPERVPRYRLIGFEKHRLEKEDFRNDKVDAAEMAAAESGNALYQFEADPGGSGDVGEVFVRFLDTSSGQMVERSWPIPYRAAAPRLTEAQPSLQLAATAGLLGEKLKGGALADTIALAELAPVANQLRGHYGEDPRVNRLIQMLEKVRSLSGE